MKKINEEIITPTFQGDDFSARQALQCWVNTIAMINEIESQCTNTQHKLSIYDALKVLVDRKVYAIQNPAVASMQAASQPVKDLNLEPQIAPEPVGSVPGQPAAAGQQEIASDTPPKLDEPANVVDLSTTEETYQKIQESINRAREIAGIDVDRAPKTISAQTQRALELAGLRVRI